ncbi:MAG TPA: hypothetical protein VGG75_12160 [Trebonia sp.]
MGDPSSDAVATRDREEGPGGTLAAKIRSSLTYYRDAARSCGAEVRLHGGTGAQHYTDSFERVWDTAKPWSGEDV